MDHCLVMAKGLCNSMKLWVMLCRAIQDRGVIVESSDKTWFTGGGNGKPLQYTNHENPMNCMKRLKDMTLKDESPRLEGVQYAAGKERRTTTNNSRKNEVARPKQKWPSALDVLSDESKIQCWKEEFSIGTWNVRIMNQGKLDVVKQEMARVNKHWHIRNQWTKIDGNRWI